MKATIENPILNITSNFGSEKMKASNNDFLFILNRILISEDEENLRRNFSQTPKSDYFIWGFGSTHMWVKQIGFDNRIIFVEF